MAFTESLEFRGQPAIALRLPHGDRVLVALHGAQVLSWQTADGTERLYLSPQALFDGQSAIRGGVPVCWPQFNMRGPLIKHGFVRNLPWQVLTTPEGTEADTLHLRLSDSAATRVFWPERFEAERVREPLRRIDRPSSSVRCCPARARSRSHRRRRAPCSSSAAPRRHSCR